MGQGGPGRKRHLKGPHWSSQDLERGKEKTSCKKKVQLKEKKLAKKHTVQRSKNQNNPDINAWAEEGEDDSRET